MVELLYKKRVQIVIVSIAFVSFLLIALDVLFDGLLTQFDQVLNRLSASWHTPLYDSIFLSITKFGNLSSMLILSILVTLILLWQKDRSSILYYWAGMLGSGVLFSGIKEIFARGRPSNYIGELFQHGYSFPSGHATMSMSFALLILYIFYPKVSSLYRSLLLLFVLISPVGIGFSRIYLGVHYFSDVSAGLVLGIFWIGTMLISFKRVRD